MKLALEKKSAKQSRERKVLLGLIETFIQTGKAVGSNTLKEGSFGDLSSATIRNYFAHLEEEGYLIQQHTSGGRIPTDKAFGVYAQDCLENLKVEFKKDPFDEIRQTETKEIASFLHQAAETLSQKTDCAVFLSTPRFDQDFITALRLVPIDAQRTLAVIVTDFGMVQTEVLNADKKLNSFMAKRIESYFHWRLTGNDEPENLTEEEKQLALRFYNEIMVRYLVSYSNFIEDEIYRTGFSKLLHYPEFHHPQALAGSLALFENAHCMRLLLRECTKLKSIKFWIGDDLSKYTTQNNPQACAVLCAPYAIGQLSVGAIGIMGSKRMPYKQYLELLAAFADSISVALTRNLFKYKISFRQPETRESYLQSDPKLLLEDNRRGSYDQ